MEARPPRADRSGVPGSEESPLHRLTAADSRELDRRAIEVHRIPGLILMEHASIGLAIGALELLGERGVAPEQARVEILCGPGNNGGDGLAVGRHLWNRGCRVTLLDLVPAGGRPQGSDADRQREINDALGIPRIDASTGPPPLSPRASLRIDAILGTGISRPPGGALERGVRALLDERVPVLSVDLPSGLDPDRGEPLGATVRAARTITLGLPKQGLAHPSARPFTGAVSYVPIGAARTEIPANYPAFPPVPCPLGEDLLPLRGGSGA